MSSIQVDLQANLVHITPSRTVALPLREVPVAIRAAGYRPTEMTIQARGTYEGERFRIRGWSEVLPIRAGAPTGDGEVTLNARVDYSGEAVTLEPLP